MSFSVRRRDGGEGRGVDEGVIGAEILLPTSAENIH